MKPKVLIVDDEPLNLSTLQAMLANDGYELHSADNGREACALAHVLQPDLILLDVMMPEMDGLAVCRYLRGDPVLALIPVIVLTALDDQPLRLEALRMGADDFMTKPCRREEIRARVRLATAMSRHRARAEQNERFQRLYEQAPMAIVLTDALGRVVAANRLAESTLAVPSKRVLAGESLRSRLDPGSAAIVAEVIAAALRGTVVVPRDLRHGEIALQVRAAAMPEDQASAALVMLIFDNVTGAARTRLALEQRNTELEGMTRAHARRLEEANTLLMSYAGFVSHDLRSPLTVIKGYLSLLHEGVVPAGPEAAPLVEQAFQATVVMQELIQNILHLAQDLPPDAGGERVAFETGQVVRRLADQLAALHPHAARRITVGPLPAVGVSGVVVERIFYNLLGNALKFSAEQAAPLIEVGAFGSEEGPVLFVRDNGVGFDARRSDRLFREFSQPDQREQAGGFGLGLSLVARLVRAQGGRLWAEGAAGGGATFFVQLPAPSAVPDEGVLAE